MENKTIFIILGVLGGGLLLCGGCCVAGIFLALPKVREAADRTQRVNDLKQIALAMQSHNDSFKRTPGKIDDIRPFVENDPRLMGRLQSGEIEVVWNAGFDQPNGRSKVIYAWDTKPSGNMRLVVFMDGSTSLLTEAEFQNAPKAAIAKADKKDKKGK